MTPVPPPSQNAPGTIATASIADRIAAHDGALTPLELAEYTGHSRKTIYAKVKKGSIPHFNFDGSIRFDPFLTAQWVRAHSV